MSTGTRLTPTSYAILGLLAVRPWSSYELTRQMERGLGRFWPRAVSKLYEEPKKLVAQGLATAANPPPATRRRTVYTITAAGRACLASWMAQPAQNPVLESEQLLRIFFAENGTKTDLLTVIASMRTWAADQRTVNATIARSYLNNEAAFPERLAHTMLVGRFLADFEDMVTNWTEWADTLVSKWPSDIADAEADRHTLGYLAHRDHRT